MSGLKIGTRTETYNSSVAKGKVVSNDNANKDVYEGTTINYVVSLGIYNVESMIGKTPLKHLTEDLKKRAFQRFGYDS